MTRHLKIAAYWVILVGIFPVAVVLTTIGVLADCGLGGLFILRQLADQLNPEDWEA